MYVVIYCDKCQEGKGFYESVIGGFFREDFGEVVFKLRLER